MCARLMKRETRRGGAGLPNEAISLGLRLSTSVSSVWPERHLFQAQLCSAFHLFESLITLRAPAVKGPACQKLFASLFFSVNYCGRYAAPRMKKIENEQYTC